MTAVRELLAAAVASLTAAGVGSPRVDAELLLADCLGISRSGLMTAGSEPVEDAVAKRFGGLLDRRAAREPLQYLLGRAPFRFLEVPVGPGVFIPRPETELLVDAVLPALRAADRPLVIDLCSGSGALALAIADEVRSARVVALERSPAALVWLRANCAGTGIEVVEGDVLDQYGLSRFDGQADAVVSNPPYVPTTVVVGPEVARDPVEAVFAGPDGLALMPAVCAMAARLLRPGGAFAVEHDDTQGQAVPALLRADARWTAVSGHRDLTGRDRFTTAVRT